MHHALHALGQKVKSFWCCTGGLALAVPDFQHLLSLVMLADTAYRQAPITKYNISVSIPGG
jgi:hypothetical protein